MRKSEKEGSGCLRGMVLGLLALLSISIVANYRSCSGSSHTPPPTADERMIPGLSAVDVHGNLTPKGFTLTTHNGPEQSEWRCKLTQGQIEYEGEAFGPATNSITSVRGTVTNYGTVDVDKAASDFLGYLASLPYQGAEPAKARQWVVENMGHNAETIIGGVKFQLISNPEVPRVRILRIAKH